MEKRKSKIDQVYEEVENMKDVRVIRLEGNGESRDITSEKITRLFNVSRDESVAKLPAQVVNEDVRNAKLNVAVDNVHSGKAKVIGVKREIAYVLVSDEGNKAFSLEELLLKVEKDKEEAKTYVCDGAKLSCKYHSIDGVFLTLRVFDDSASLMGRDPIATETDKEPENFEYNGILLDVPICNITKKECSISNPHWEDLLDNVLSSGKKVVVSTSKLYCSKSSEPLEIVHNGQEFYDWEGWKNDKLRFNSENPYIIKGFKGGLKTGGGIVLIKGSIVAIAAGGPPGWVAGILGLAAGIKETVEGPVEIVEAVDDFNNRYNYESEVKNEEENEKENKEMETAVNNFYEQKKEISEFFEKRETKDYTEDKAKDKAKGKVKGKIKDVFLSPKTYDYAREWEEKHTNTHIIRTIYPDKEWQDITIDYFKGNTYIVEKTEAREVEPE